MADLSEYHRILVGVDGSRQAKKAYDKAVAVAKRNQSVLIIVSVLSINKLVGLGATQAGFGAVDQTVLDEVKEKMDRLVADYQKQAIQSGVSQVETSVSYGNPKTELAQVLPETFNADLIILGATGLNAVQRMVMGSNASYVVANAQSDVLIVRTAVAGDD